ncbi:MAG: YdcF family protein [Dehalococcoidia bacterium]
MLDVAVISCARVIKKRNKIVPAFHTEMRARAGGITYKRGLVSKLLLSGGHAISVRYNLNPKESIFAIPDFSAEAIKRAHKYPSEARVVRDFIERNYDVPAKAMILQEISLATSGEAAACKPIIDKFGFKNIGIITNLYHMEKVFGVYQEAGIKVEPLFAEDFLVLENPTYWIPKIVKYYSTRRGGKDWDIEKLNTTDVPALASFK